MVMFLGYTLLFRHIYLNYFYLHHWFITIIVFIIISNGVLSLTANDPIILLIMIYSNLPHKASHSQPSLLSLCPSYPSRC
jgi:hypothetical protein